MTLVLTVLGVLSFLMFVLASMNGLRKYTKHQWIKKISKNHKIFGLSATLLALVHLILAISLGELRLTGLLALVFLMLTGFTGMLFAKLKKKLYYKLHRILGPLAFIFILIHMILNYKY